MIPEPSDTILQDLITSGLHDSERPGAPGENGNPCPTGIMCLAFLMNVGIAPERTMRIVEDAVQAGLVQYHDISDEIDSGGAGDDKSGITLTDAGREQAPAALERMLDWKASIETQG